MIFEVSQDPSRSVNQIYEEVRNSITQTMTTQEKQLFLSAFPTFRAIQSTLYKKRRELLPPNPKRMTDFKLDLTPKLWTQTFIISAQVTSGVFIPVVFVLLPDKKRDSYDAMFSMLAECLESRDLQLSATYFMSGTILLSFSA